MATEPGPAGSRDESAPPPPPPPPPPLPDGDAFQLQNLHFPSDVQAQEWEAKAQTWLSRMAAGRDITFDELDGWIDSNLSSLPETLKPLSRSQLRHRIIYLHKLIRNDATEAKNNNHDDTPQPRFVRTNQWMPVYSWLESLDTNEVVKSKDISEWLSENPKVKDQLYARHSRYHLMHYIQKLHLKMLRKREKLKKALQPIQAPMAVTTSPMKINDNGATAKTPSPCEIASNLSQDNETYASRRSEAFLRYELFTELQNRLGELFARQRKPNRLTESNLPTLVRRIPAENMTHRVDVSENDKEKRISNGDPGSASPMNAKSDNKRKRSDGEVPPAWSHSETSGGMQSPSLGAICDASQSI